MALGFEKEPWIQGHFGQNVEQKSSIQATMFWYALNCVEPPLSCLKNRKCPGANGLLIIMSSFLRSCSQVHRLSVCARF